MIAIAITLAVLGMIVSILVRTLRHDGAKIVAALAGRSWLAEPPMSARPVRVRFSQRYPVAQPPQAAPTLTMAAWRAAA